MELEEEAGRNGKWEALWKGVERISRELQCNRKQDHKYSDSDRTHQIVLVNSGVATLCGYFY